MNPVISLADCHWTSSIKSWNPLDLLGRYYIGLKKTEYIIMERKYLSTSKTIWKSIRELPKSFVLHKNNSKRPTNCMPPFLNLPSWFDQCFCFRNFDRMLLLNFTNWASQESIIKFGKFFSFDIYNCMMHIQGLYHKVTFGNINRRTTCITKQKN